MTEIASSWKKLIGAAKDLVPGSTPDRIKNGESPFMLGWRGAKVDGFGADSVFEKKMEPLFDFLFDDDLKLKGVKVSGHIPYLSSLMPELDEMWFADDDEESLSNWLGNMAELVEAYAYYAKTGEKLPIHIQFEERQQVHIMTNGRKNLD